MFARRMMHLASDKAVIPEENFAKKGSNCNKAVMTKRFFTDTSMVLHHPAGLGGYDFSDCYDRVAHTPISVALQAWRVPKEAVRTMLIALQVMQFFLRTGFGKSKHSYGGTLANPNQGLGQGNGAAPPGFHSLSALILNAYRRMGHGAKLHRTEY